MISDVKKKAKELFSRTINVAKRPEELEKEIKEKSISILADAEHPEYADLVNNDEEFMPILMKWNADIAAAMHNSNTFSVYEPKEIQEAKQLETKEKITSLEGIVIEQALTIDSLYQVIDTLDEEIDEYQELTDHYLHQNTNLNQSVEYLKVQLMDSEDELDLTKDEMELLAQTILELQSDLVDERNKANFHEKEITKTKQEIDGLSGEMRIIQQSKQAADALTDSQYQQLSDLNGKIASLSAYISQLEAEREVARGLIKKKIDIANDLTQRNTKLDSRNQGLEAENLKLQESLISLNNRISSLESERGTLQNKADNSASHQAEIDKKNQEIRSLRAEIDRLKEAKKKVVSE